MSPNEKRRRLFGVIENFDPVRGFGWIVAADGGKWFAHISEFPWAWRALDVRDQVNGQSVQFTTDRDARGRARAIEIFICHAEDTHLLTAEIVDHA